MFTIKGQYQIKIRLVTKQQMKIKKQQKHVLVIQCSKYTLLQYSKVEV